MFRLVVIGKCQPWSFVSFQYTRQMAVCTIHMCSMQSSSGSHGKLRVPSYQFFAQKSYKTDLITKSYFSADLHVKGKSPPDLEKKSRFEFFSLKSLFSTPEPFMIYGLGGLIPFMSAPAFMYLTGEFNPFIAQAQLAYGACILSFLGGVSWGNHLRSERASLKSLSYSIFLPLLAWPALLFSPSPISFLVLTGGIIYAGVKDTSTATYPRWFKNLRFLLSTLVALSLTTTIILKFTLTKKEDDKYI